MFSGGKTMVQRNPQSTAQIAGHPLHPMLIPFPVAFLVATFVCDLIFWRTGNPAWSTASLWLLGAALIMAALAAVAGLTDFLGDPRIRDLGAAWHHMIGNVIVALLSLWNWYRRYEAGDAAVLPIGPAPPPAWAVALPSPRRRAGGEGCRRRGAR